MNECLRKIKKEQNLSINDMAKKLNVSFSLLTKILYGQREPSKEFIKKVKTVFPNTDTNIFFTN
jgi:transcriptional regulator with XRE-family HTH domain